MKTSSIIIGVSNMFEDLMELIGKTKKLRQGVEGEVILPWVEDVEKALGYKLPSSYRWWLLKYGSGFLGGDPIYTIAPPEFRDIADSDILHSHLLNTRNGMTAPDRLYFYEPDGDERFFFDMGRSLGDGDNPVMVEDLSQNEIREYGGTFADFLKKEINMSSP